MITRKLRYKGNSYTLAFDDEGILDTVHKSKTGGAEQRHGGQADVQFFVRHQDTLRIANPVKGVDYTNY